MPRARKRGRRGRQARRRSRARPRTAPAPGPPPSLRGFWVPGAATLALLVLALQPRVQDNPILLWSFLGAASAVAVWQVVLHRRLRRASAGRSFTVVLRPQHYLQAAVQLSVFAYWGWYWRPVYDFAGLLLAQLAFAYAFDILLAWSRRRDYALGFGPFPIIFSTNLFLWFRDDWFYLQFLMIAVGFLGKEFVRWNREGRRRHIFNPSAFSLGLFSAVLILTGTSDLTWGQDIASTLTLAPRIYLFLFLLGLVVMYFFSITLVAGTAAATLFGLSALYSALEGVPYFVDSEIPAAVFLGLHLLVTDPSTSPRTPLGKAVFGTGYGLSVFALYSLLGVFGAPTFYDKLLAVPVLNLSVRAIDALVGSAGRWGALARLGQSAPTRRLNLAQMGIWILLFLSMTALGRTDGRHTGDSLPFWEAACEEGRRNACRQLVQLELSYCADNSAWACNELGAHYSEGRIVAADPGIAERYFAQACELRFQAGCVNLLDATVVSRSPPKPLDLRLLLREGGRNLMETPEPELYRRACEHLWSFACGPDAPAT